MKFIEKYPFRTSAVLAGTGFSALAYLSHVLDGISGEEQIKLFNETDFFQNPLDYGEAEFLSGLMGVGFLLIFTGLGLTLATIERKADSK